MKKIVVLYHADCPDGFSGAWAAWKKFGKKADYIGQDRKNPLPKLKNKEVYFIDYAPRPAAVVRDLVKNNKQVTIIDHHITAKPIIKFASEHLFDINHSGAVLAWLYFHPSKPLPHLLRYIEDCDIWKWKMPRAQEITSYINLIDFNFKNWDRLSQDFENKNKLKKIIEKGAIILAYRKKLIEEILGEAELVNFEGYKILAANAPSFLDSDLGHAMAKKQPPLSIVWRREKDITRFSLRSNGKVNVAKIAEKFGGGGHKAASGFRLPANKPLPWKSVLNPKP